MNLMSERQIEKIINLMQTDDSADAPPDAIRWAKNIFAARAAAPQKSIVNRIFAVLQMDLSPNRAAFGERSASASKARQMLFRAGENALDLRITKTENGFSIQGQILGGNYAHAAVSVGDFQAKANENSEFKFAEIPAGVYDFRLTGGDVEIILEHLEIK